MGYRRSRGDERGSPARKTVSWSAGPSSSGWKAAPRDVALAHQHRLAAEAWRGPRRRRPTAVMRGARMKTSAARAAVVRAPRSCRAGGPRRCASPRRRAQPKLGCVGRATARASRMSPAQVARTGRPLAREARRAPARGRAASMSRSCAVLSPPGRTRPSSPSRSPARAHQHATRGRPPSSARACGVEAALQREHADASRITQPRGRRSAASAERARSPARASPRRGRR